MLMISTRVSAVGTDQKDRQKEVTHASITTEGKKAQQPHDWGMLCSRIKPPLEIRLYLWNYSNFQETQGKCCNTNKNIQHLATLVSYFSSRRNAT